MKQAVLWAVAKKLLPVIIGAVGAFVATEYAPVHAAFCRPSASVMLK